MAETFTEHLDRIGGALSGYGCSPVPCTKYSAKCPRCTAMESLTALRASIAEMERQYAAITAHWNAAFLRVQKLALAAKYPPPGPFMESMLTVVEEQIAALIIERQKAAWNDICLLVDGLRYFYGPGHGGAEPTAIVVPIASIAHAISFPRTRNGRELCR